MLYSRLWVLYDAKSTRVANRAHTPSDLRVMNMDIKGRKLNADILEWAYRQGIFPMGYKGEVFWFCPDPRAILPLDGFRVSRSLRRSARKFDVTFDEAFVEVMRGCAERPSTWIGEEFIEAYSELFDRGRAHSVETWREGRLVGGVYGVALGRALMAESMFHRETDAGKVALWRLVERMQETGYVLLDVQMMTPHLRSLGAIEISAREYIGRLAEALQGTTSW